MGIEKHRRKLLVIDTIVPGSGSGGGAVDSVNGKTGDVNLTAADVGALPNTYSPDVTDIDATGTPSGTTYLRGDGAWSEIPAGGAVDSVNGQTGAVVIDAADVGARPDTYVPTWTEVTDKPTTFPPVIGTGATDAKAGNYVPTWNDVSNKPTTFPPIIGTGPTDAKAGDYLPSWEDVANKPVIIAAGATALEARNAIGVTWPSIDVRSKGAVADNSTDDSAAFIAAQTEAISTGRLSVRVPYGEYVVNNPVNMEDGVTWIFEGPKIRHTDATKKIFSAVGKRGISMLGRAKLYGTYATGAALTSPETLGECGLYLENCRDVTIENILVENFKGNGIQVSGTTGGAPYGDKTHFSEIQARNCTVGAKIDAGSGAEFCTWTNPFITGCASGFDMAAANHTVIGGIVASNTLGIKLRDGANHLHGIFSGTNIAHNVTSVDISDVTLGHGFYDCYIQQGPILISNSARIIFDGGRIDVTSFQVTLGANSGDNWVRNMALPGAVATFSVTGDGAKTIKFTDCFGPGNNATATSTDGLDEAAVFRGTAKQTLTSATDAVALFNSTLCNNAASYINATGLYTVKTGGLYEIQFNMICGGTALNAGASTLVFEIAPAANPTVFAPAFVFMPNGSATRLCFSGVFRTRLAVGSVIRPVLNITGTTPTFSDGVYNSTMSIRCAG